jgi:hypothetical protein
MRVYKSHFRRFGPALAASVVALFAAAPVLAEEVQPAAPAFEPKLADYLSIYDALQHYRWGVEKHDQEMQDSAFWDPPKHQPIPPGLTPPPGSNAGPPGPGGPGGKPPSWDEIKKMPGFVEVWHLPLDSYIHFDSATRATHYEYFLSIYPQPEKKRAEGDTGNMQESRISKVGWPGHYEDILEKRNGEWRILQRKTLINEK